MRSSEITEANLLARAKAGSPQALGELLQTKRASLLRIIEFRMDHRLRGRLDAADVVQDAFIEATERFRDFTDNQEMPFFLWLRFITIQKLAQLHRHHLGVKARDAGREVLLAGPRAQATSAVLAANLLGKLTSPSRAAIRAEATLRVERALNAMDDIDREILALRHFERLTNVEVARLLELSETAASNRYMRALSRLRREIEGVEPSEESRF